MNRAYPRRAALDLVNALFGGRFTSLLNTELRIRTGLSYGAGSGFTRGRAAGEFAIRSFAETRHTLRAIDLALTTLARLKRDGVTQAMVDSARSYVMGQYPMNLETAADWAAQLAELELYGLDPGSIEGYGAALRQVSLQAARQVIDEAFPAGRQLALVVIGDATRLGRRLERYGPYSGSPWRAAASLTDTETARLKRTRRFADTPEGFIAFFSGWRSFTRELAENEAIGVGDGQCIRVGQALRQGDIPVHQPRHADGLIAGTMGFIQVAGGDIGHTQIGACGHFIGSVVNGVMGQLLDDGAIVAREQLLSVGRVFEAGQHQLAGRGGMRGRCHQHGGRERGRQRYSRSLDRLQFHDGTPWVLSVSTHRMSVQE